MDRPIGVFDSGIGGLTVLKALLHHLPNETFLYVGDTARVPYGSKSAETVTLFSLQIGTWLVSQNVKAIVVACNTASAHSLPLLRQSLPIPVFGVIQPGAIAAISKSRGKIGVLATRGTVLSGVYEQTLKRISYDVQVWSQPAPLLVPLIEEGEIEGDILEMILSKYLIFLKVQQCDTLLLGCTHYPIIKPTISKLWPEVQIVDSAESTAVTVRNELQIRKLYQEIVLEKNLQERYKIYLTDLYDTFLQSASLFLQSTLSHYELLTLETLENTFYSFQSHA
ncbi:MAG: glutamate racemase [bacterium]|nr:glutamate racemase [bacterium]